MATAAVVAAALALGGCRSQPDERARIERELIATTATTLAVDGVSAACTAAPDGHHACVVTAPGREPFVALVEGRDDDGRLRWRAQGTANIEFVIARGVAQQLEVATTSAKCPRAGCIGDGFECAVSLADGTRIPVDISEVEGGEQFRWKTRGVIAEDDVASLVRQRLDASRQGSRIDCGPALRVSRPGTTFSCAISPATGSGPDEQVEIRVLDWNGRVNVGDVPGAGDTSGVTPQSPPTGTGEPETAPAPGGSPDTSPTAAHGPA